MPLIFSICVFPETLFIRGLTEMVMILTHNSRDKPLHILIDQCFWQSPGAKHWLLCSDKGIVCLDKLKYTGAQTHPWSLRAPGQKKKKKPQLSLTCNPLPKHKLRWSNWETILLFIYLPACTLSSRLLIKFSNDFIVELFSLK